jgi:RNA polymerase sigma-70 factor (ECF subfamily)
MEREKFEEILQKEGKKIFNYLLKILRNRSDAEDLLQEVFIAFYKKMDTINENAFSSYLFKTAYHKSLNYIKKRKKTEKFSHSIEELENIPQPQNNGEEKDRLNKIISSCMQKLKPEQAFILELQFFQKKSYREIAKILETSESAVDSKLVRAKRKLRKIISSELAKLSDNYRKELYGK